MLGDGATDDDERRIQPVHEDDGEVAQRSFGARDDRDGFGLSRGGGRVHTRGVVHAVGLGKKSPSGEGLDAAVAPASAAWALERHRKMADLARDIRHPAKHPAATDEPSADAGRDRDVDVIADALRRAVEIRRCEPDQAARDTE